MIKKINVFMLVFMLTCFSLQTIAYAISMAAFTENNHQTVKRGETAQFFIFFWNPEDEPSPVRLEATEVPEELIVIITPNDFMLNSSLVTEFPAEKGRNYVNTKQGLMMTTSVKVSVKVPRTAELESYDVVITATAGSLSKQVSTLLEKKFRFTVNATSLTFSENLYQIGKDVTSGIVDTGKRITGMAPVATVNSGVVFLILLVICLLVVSWVIYKKLRRRSNTQYPNLSYFLGPLLLCIVILNKP